MRAVVAFVFVVFVVFAASRCPGVFRRSRPRPLSPGGTGKGLQCKNCSIFGSCSRRCGKGWRCKSHSKALRKQVAETSTPCSFPPSPPTPPPPGGSGGLNSPMWPTVCLGSSSRATANIQICREPDSRQVGWRCLRSLSLSSDQRKRSRHQWSKKHENKQARRFAIFSGLG